jgi:hypothetical protein
MVSRAARGREEVDAFRNSFRGSGCNPVAILDGDREQWGLGTAGDNGWDLRVLLSIRREHEEAATALTAPAIRLASYAWRNW